MLIKIIQENQLNKSPWLPCDKMWKWEFWDERVRIRLSRFGRRIDLLPIIGIDWEVGIITLQFGWLCFMVSFDWEFDVDWEQSEEANLARQDERNKGIKV